jgi:VWFA-related protein
MRLPGRPHAWPLGLAAAAAIGLSAAAQTQAPRPVFRSGVDLVAVEVQVVNRDGVPVPALGITDFEVKIDGKRRRIISADLVNFDPAVVAAAPAPAAAPPAALPPAARPTRDRIFVLAVDEASLRPSDAMVATRAARKFIDSLHESDYVGLYKYPVISRQLDLTHGHAAVKIALEKIVGGHMWIRGEFDLLPSEIVDLTAGDRDTWDEVVRRECAQNADGTLADLSCPDRIIQEARTAAGYAEGDAATRIHALRLLLDALATVPGRKTLVVVSGGMFSSDRAVGRPDVTSSMIQLGKEAAVANTLLYVMHLDSSFFESLNRAPRSAAAAGDTPLFARSFRDGQIFGQGLEQLAGAAGGGYLRIQAGTPDYAFSRVVRENAAYYLLAVEPDERERDGRLHFLRVSAKVKGALVRSRTHVVIPRRR